MKISILIVASAALVIVTTSVISAAVVSIAQDEKGEGTLMSEMGGDGDQGKEEITGLISELTEWTGMIAMGTAGGLAVTIAVNKKSASYAESYQNSTSPTEIAIFVLIAILSIAVGIIHLLLIEEHMKESFIWGVGFLIMGITQVAYGIIMVSAWRLPLVSKNLLYQIGIAGNSLFVAIFVYARLFVPPFSPEEAPVSELEPNGIITLLIEGLIVSLLIHLARKKVKEQASKMRQ